ncbi:MAG: hypothetical protein LH631_05240, partial [Alkalinema sp. CAN_BIN05]|nr:hypothetical protein [Alkalinema sp. CAN_BIN05]
MNAQISRQWIVGTSLSGKTRHLLTTFQTWSQQVTPSHGSFIDLPSIDRSSLNLGQSAIYPRALVLSAIGDNRLVLTDRLTT